MTYINEINDQININRDYQQLISKMSYQPCSDRTAMIHNQKSHVALFLACLFVVSIIFAFVLPSTCIRNQSALYSLSEVNRRDALITSISLLDRCCSNTCFPVAPANAADV